MTISYTVFDQFPVSIAPAMTRIMRPSRRRRAGEAQAKRRLADEYDAAQARGEVARSGDTLRTGPGVPKQNAGKATAADVGLTRKEIHEARRICDADEPRRRSEEPPRSRRQKEPNGADVKCRRITAV